MIGRLLGPSAPRVQLLVLVSVVVLVSCGPQPLSVTREPITLSLVAASSCEPFAREAAAGYEATHPWVTVTIEVLNNGLTRETLLEGRADLGLLSWHPSTGDQGNELWSEPFARDGIAVIVHPDSPLREIGLRQLQDIYRGHLQETQGVVLTVVSREAGSGTRSAFEHVVLDGGETSLNAVVVPSAAAMSDYVAETEAGIGYASTRSLDDRVRVLPVEGVLPSDESIRNGRYPMLRELSIASAGEPRDEARQFAQWLLRAAPEMTTAQQGGLDEP